MSARAEVDRFPTNMTKKKMRVNKWQDRIYIRDILSKVS